GQLQEVLVQPGEIVKIGAPIAVMAVDAEATTHVPTTATPLPQRSSAPAAIRAQPIPEEAVRQELPSDGRRYSPLVRHIAQKENVALEELSHIPGTGKDNRVTKRDLMAYLQHRPQASSPATRTVATGPIAPEDVVIPLDRVRRMIADRMVTSKRVAPHVTSFVEADVTALVHWRREHKAAFEQKNGLKLTYTPLLIQAIARALQDFPRVNAWMDTDQVIQKKAINIGLAVALPDGNLVVPVIQHADQCSLVDLTQQVHTLANKARLHQLAPDDLAGATYTVSNLGSFQNLMGTPIIMQPQVAILALGAIVKKPAVVASTQGDTIAIRHMMYLSHTYDHRVIDGAMGGSFVKRVAEYLEQFVDWVAY
ncbi:MAG: dihydrolipoamide acetyltransferase family protein, partial [Bacteroidota bacterium]